MTDPTADLSPAALGQLLDALPDGARVLDLGCGDGSFSYAAVPRLAIDALDEFPAPPQPFPGHVRYRQGRAEALPYDADTFDLVVTNFVLEHVTDFPASIREIARVLETGGHLYMAVPNARSFEDALYRGLFAGGGHLQRHTFESVIATVYRLTALKLIGYLEWPAGFTFLQDREGLRALVGIVERACREALGVELRPRSNYHFIFRREHGRGYATVIAVCGYCGGGVVEEIDTTRDWTCPHCDRVNHLSVRGEASDTRLDADMRAFHERYPAIRDATMSDVGRAATEVPPPEVSPAPPTETAERDLLRRVRLAWRMLRYGSLTTPPPNEHGP